MIAVEVKEDVPEVAEIISEGDNSSKKGDGMLPLSLPHISREERRTLSASLTRKNRSVDLSKNM